MPSTEPAYQTYQALADHYAEEGQAQLRDRFMVLAAESLFSAGRTSEAERVRMNLLNLNPHHLIKPFPSIEQALRSGDVKTYIAGLRRTYPPDKAAQLLRSLANERHASPTETPRPQETDKPVRALPVSPPGKEDLKVYRFQDDIDPEASLPRARPAPMHRNAPPESSVRPGRLPLQAASPPPVSPWRPDLVDGDREGLANIWVASILFWIVLLFGLVLVGAAFLTPFFAFS